jgi:hypothetical protein
MMDKLWLALAAWGAGVLVALLGFLESKEKFEPRKFAASVVRSLIAGVIWGAAYNLDKPLSWEVILGAIASGPFFDIVVNRAGTLLGNSSFPLPAEKPNTPAPPEDPPPRLPIPPSGAAGSTP